MIVNVIYPEFANKITPSHATGLFVWIAATYFDNAEPIAENCSFYLAVEGNPCFMTALLLCPSCAIVADKPEVEF